MSFLNSALLGLAALFAVPLIIHLLNRRRYRVLPWAAMEFLLLAYQRTRRRMRMESLLLLLLRCAIPILLALAVARPRLGQATALPLDRKGTHHILILDRSYSMGYQEEGIRRPFDRLKEWADGIVGQIAKNGTDRISLILVDDRVTTPLRGELSLPTVRKTLSEIVAPSDGKARLLPALKAAQSLASKQEEPARIYVISDFQRSFLESSSKTDEGEGGPDQALVDILGDFHDQEIPVLFLPVSPRGVVQNTIVTDLSVDPANTVARIPASVRAQVIHRGPAQRELLATMTLDGQNPVQRPVRLGPGEEKEIRFPIRFLEPGYHAIEVGLTEDGLPVDDVRRQVVEVRDRIRILCVEGGQGDPDEDPLLRPGFLYRNLLDPLADLDESEIQPGQERLLTFDVQLVDELRFQSDPSYFKDVDIIALLDFSGPREDLAQRLKDFVRRGGGLLIAPGPDTLPDLYNLRLFGKDGKGGPLPLRLLEIRGFRGQLGRGKGGTIPDRYATPRILDPESPLLRDFYDEPNLDKVLEAMPVYRYFATDLLSQPKSTEVILGLDQTDDPERLPLLAIRDYGRGKCALLTSNPTKKPDRWNELNQLFVALPLLHRLAHTLAEQDQTHLNRVVGQGLSTWIEGMPSSLYMTRPGNEGRVPLPLPTKLQSGVSQLSPFHATFKAGLYRLGIGFADKTRQSKEVLFAVNPDPEEGILDYVSAAALQQDYPTVEIQTQVRLEKADVVEAGTTELGRFLMMLVLLVGISEALLAGRLGRRRQ